MKPSDASEPETGKCVLLSQEGGSTKNGIVISNWSVGRTNRKLFFDFHQSQVRLFGKMEKASCDWSKYSVTILYDLIYLTQVLLRGILATLQSIRLVMAFLKANLL